MTNRIIENANAIVKRHNYDFGSVDREANQLFKQGRSTRDHEVALNIIDYYNDYKSWWEKVIANPLEDYV